MYFLWDRPEYIYIQGDIYIPGGPEKIESFQASYHMKPK